MLIDDTDATTQILQIDLSETPRVLLVDDPGRLCTLCLDIDHFKQINDRYGHAAGDAVLQEFVRRINQHLGTRWCARIGGEEFVVVLGNADREAAHKAAESIRVAVAAEPVQTSAGTIRCTVSIGICGWPSRTPGRVTTETLLQEGDQALYASKANGRNRVTLATSLEDP